MADVTVDRFAESVGISVARLQEQLREAGISAKKPEDSLSEAEKTQLLSYLRKMHGKNETAPEPEKITLRRKTISEIKLPTERRPTRLRGTKSGGVSKTVSIEVRKKRTYVKRKTSVEQDLPLVDEKEQELNRVRTEEAKLQQAREEAARDAAVEEKLRVEAERIEAERVAAERAEAERIEAEKAEVERIEAEKAEAARIAAEKEAEESKRLREAEEAKQLVQEAPLKETPSGRKNLKSKDRRAQEREERAELHVARDKSGRRRKKASSPRVAAGPTGGKHGFEKPTAPVVREVDIPESISVGDLAGRMSVKAGEVIKVMMNLGSIVTINQILDQDTAILVVEELGHKSKVIKDTAVDESIKIEDDNQNEVRARAPIVTIMGHVDHGKTSLLDFIRESRVAAGEAGGITQHIGAYKVSTDSGDITFLDTPGHEAFTAMRARGAGVTDIVVLVVAADDGVMPQTEEAIKHAKAADVPLVVAVNKIDKAEAQPDKVKQELANREVVPEDWGGDTQFINVSAKNGEGIDLLLEAILLQSDLLEVKAPVEGNCRGVVVESRLDKGRGPVATILVQSGKLLRGQIIVAGSEFGRVRAMLGPSGDNLLEAGPSQSVEIVGLSGTPRAGEDAAVVSDEKRAREICSYRLEKERETRLSRRQSFQMENMFAKMEDGEKANFKVLLKTDVQGSSEAISDSLAKINTTEVRVDVVADGVGAITESDVNLAFASEAIILAFNVRAEASARKLLEEEGIEIRYYSVIYELIEDVKAAVSGLLAPEIRETIIGIAEVKDVFRSSKLGAIAGCIVSEGQVKKSNPIRVLRESVVIYEGELESLRRFKDDVQTVQSGTECGIGVKNYNDVKAGDQIEVYERIEVARSV